MLRSMFTAISALNLHQNYLDVIANNLANANTTGYKSNRLLFQDQFYQMMNPGASPSGGQGGINPTQIGLGLQIGYISPIFTQGMLQSTGRNMDMAVQGDGFFVYGQGDQRRYSREGSLTLDSAGYLVNASTGLHVQGWMSGTGGAINPNLPPSSIQIDTNETIATATSGVVLGGNLNSTAANGTVVNTTMGVYDSLGQSHTVSVSYTRTSDSQWDWTITDPAGAGSGSVTFDPATGQLASGGTSGTITIPGSAGAAPISFEIDMSSLTMLATDTNVAPASQNGLPPGSVSDVFITPNDGSIFLIYSNGMRQQVGQLAMARFTNPTGLMQEGNTSFSQGVNSGEAQIGTAGTGGRGKFASGYLEASNVDMAQEFTNMILAQRGFQASSRVITTSDEILQELVNLRR